MPDSTIRTDDDDDDDDNDDDDDDDIQSVDNLGV